MAAINHRKQSARKNKPAQQPAQQQPSGALVLFAVRLIKRALCVRGVYVAAAQVVCSVQLWGPGSIKANVGAER